MRSSRNSGLKRAFIHWAQAVTQVLAFCKISENRHTFARLRCVKDDGLPAIYSPDFLVRTAGAVYLVETKGQEQTIHPNVQPKLKAALAWCDRINNLTDKKAVDCHSITSCWAKLLCMSGRAKARGWRNCWTMHGYDRWGWLRCSSG